MNFDNYDRLVNYLKQLDPALFHYGQPTSMSNAACGCVAIHMRRLFEERQDAIHGGLEPIKGFLDVTTVEASYLYGSAGDRWVQIEPASALPEVAAPQVWHLKGEAGITEALRRLGVVAARYERPERSTPFIPDEAGFLASIRALGVNPIPEEVTL